MRKWLLGLVCVMKMLSADISEIRELDGVLPHVETGNPWVIFDIDLVLIQPTEPAFQMANLYRHREVVRQFLKEIPAHDHALFFGLMSFQSDSELVDPKLHPTLSMLAAQGVPSIALTSSVTGNGGGFENLAKHKLNELQHHRIDFSASSPHPDPIVFDQLPHYHGGYSLFCDGVLFANGPECPKGEVLLAFLEATGHAPQKVVFVDDRRHNLDDVEAALVARFPGIEFVGLHYTGATHRPTEEITAEQFEARWRLLANSIL